MAAGPRDVRFTPDSDQKEEPLMEGNVALLNRTIARRRKPASASRRHRRIAFALVITGFLGGLPSRGDAAGLQCPELAPGAMSNPLADPKRAQLVTTGNSTDLANEIYDLINRLQIERPNISYTE